MRNVRVLSATVRGVEASPVEIEVELVAGYGRMTMIGLPDNVIRESRERVRAALASTGLRAPRESCLINLAPARTPKSGPAFDLPVALALAATQDEVSRDVLDETLAFGELRLDGRVRPVAAAVALAAIAPSTRARRLVVPHECARLAATASGLPTFGVQDLEEAVLALQGGLEGPPLAEPLLRLEDAAPRRRATAPDLADLRGSPHASRALTVAAAGRHHLLLVGPPGVGKSMLARRLPGLLPRPALDEALEITRVHSIGDSELGELLVERPFRAPHHSSSAAAILGSAAGRPGELSLAHRGVLFLDELPEFRRDVLEALRQPLEDGHLMIGRARGSVRLPCDTQVVAAMNPCPCGFHAHPKRSCACTSAARNRYAQRISGPLLERFDLVLRMHPIASEDLLDAPSGRSSAAARVDIERTLVRGAPASTLELDALRNAMPITDEAQQLLAAYGERLASGARTLVRTWRVSLTIARLDEKAHIDLEAMAEALSYRPTEELFGA